jgi:NAD-dependent dihydropyrimidine dehydrogenase PreA subunit
MGIGAGFGAAPVPIPQQPAQGPAGDEELVMLNQQAKAMSQQTQQIQQRIRQLEQEDYRKGNGMAATVDTEKCTGCGACVEACPLDAISLQGEIAVVDEDTCTECGLCVEECPNDAIALPV